MFNLNNDNIQNRLKRYVNDPVWCDTLDHLDFEGLFQKTSQIDYAWLVQLLLEEKINVPDKYKKYLTYKISYLIEPDSGYITKNSDYPDFKLEAYISAYTEEEFPVIRLLSAFFYTEELTKYFNFTEFDLDDTDRAEFTNYDFSWYLTSDGINEDDYANLNAYDGVYLTLQIPSLGTISFINRDKSFYEKRDNYYVPVMGMWCDSVNQMINKINEAY